VARNRAIKVLVTAAVREMVQEALAGTPTKRRRRRRRRRRKNAAKAGGKK